MTTVVTTSNSEVTTPTSYVSRWIAQSHGTYQRKSNEYSVSSCNYQTSPSKTVSINKIPTKTHSFSHKTTWQVQAKSRLDNTTSIMNPYLSLNNNNNNNTNNELQEKLNRVRALLDAKKQRLCRHISSASTSTATSSTPSATTIPLVTSFCLQDQVHNYTIVGDPSSSPPLSTSPRVALDNVYHSNDESLSSSNAIYGYNSCQHLHHHHHHHHHALPSNLPCLMEESPSDSGLSDGTKTTNHDDANELSKNAAIIDLSKPLSKEEILAIMQILRELWKKQYDCDMPELQLNPISQLTPSKPIVEKSNLLHNNRIQYHSTPALNKLTSELNDIKDKLKRFSTENQQQSSTGIKLTESESSQVDLDEHPCNEDSICFSFDASLTPQELERMEAKREILLQRQNERREEQLVKRQERQSQQDERYDEYHLFEEYLAQRRQIEEQRRENILKAHLEQKRFEAGSPFSNNYYFAAARNCQHLKRKPSVSSFLSFDDDLSFNSSLNITPTPKRNATRFDLMSPSLTAATAASKSKMNRASSICNINGHYDSSTSLNSKAKAPTSLFGGSLMNLSKAQLSKRQSLNLVDDTLDDSQFSSSMTSLATSLTGPRVVRNLTSLTTKSNKQAILNSLKQVALAGPANETQRDIIIREIESSEARHFVLLFRDHRLQFRAVYMYIPETDIIEKLFGVGPNIITEVMVDKWFKYNSGSKRFTNIPIRHFSIQCDAIIIHNEFWQKKLLTNMNKIH